MKADLICKYLAPSLAASKGQMKRPRIGICSTRKQQETGCTTTPTKQYPLQRGEGNEILTPGKVVSPTDIHVIPMESGDESAYNVFCYAALADKHTGTMYTNATDVILWLMYAIQITSLPFRFII